MRRGAKSSKHAAQHRNYDGTPTCASSFQLKVTMPYMPLPVSSDSTPQTLVDLWMTEKYTCVPDNAWRWIDTVFFVLFILFFLFIVGLVCQDADLTVQLVELKGGTWAEHIRSIVMRYFGEGVREDLLQKYIRDGLAASKRRLKREIKAELLEAYRKRQRKDKTGNSQHGSRPAPRFNEDASEYAERLARWTEEQLRHEMPTASLWLRRQSTGEIIEISREEARGIAQATSSKQ